MEVEKPKRWERHWMTFEEVVTWLRRYAEDGPATDLVCERLIQQFILDNGGQAEVDALVAELLDPTHPLVRHRLFDAYRLVVTGKTSLELVERTHTLLVSQGHYQQARNTLRLVGRRKFTATELETMIRAYYAGGIYSAEDDQLFGRLVNKLPKGKSRRKLEVWIAKRLAARA